MKIESKFISSLEKKYSNHLHDLIDEIYEIAAAKQWTWSELALNSGISYSTVLKLGNRDTKYPRHMTIWKMAKAVGKDIELVRHLMRKAG